MTKKIALADIIRDQNKYGPVPFARSHLETLAAFCKRQNGNFDRELWLAYIAGECGPSGGRWERAMTNLKDTVCECIHWIEEHDENIGQCNAPFCLCLSFKFDPELNTPEAIADRGGEHQEGCVCAMCEEEKRND